ncbi:hypothetical protein CHS0354_008518 [Potamilus streckersoni]|uniref:Uncharacterized protein n=1 Tax=Potamilus streckersoni TaxID=2493646 RepID=A0AAE0VRZ2_9BIVA|nr:hypothetical protein CHS0354_008518 [Potamilus streckersoni]
MALLAKGLVKKALELNRNLMYVNEHQKCILAMKNADLSRLQSEVVDLKVAQSTQSDQQGMKLQLEIDNTCLKQKFDSSIKERECLLKDCESWKDKYQGSLASLQEAHSLIAVNLQNLERYRSEVSSNEERIEELKAELDEATLSLTSADRMIEEERQTFSITEQKWYAQEERYLCDIDQLKAELSVLKSQLEKKDLAQQEVINQVTSLSKELDMLKSIVSVEKASLSCQTNLCMLKLEDHGCQTVIEVQCQQVQTERHLKNTSTMQTISAALKNNACQTENSSYNGFSGCPSTPSTQGHGLNEHISAQGSLQVLEDHMNKNDIHKIEMENTVVKCIKKEESDIGSSNMDSSVTQTAVGSKFIDIARVLSDTQLDNEYEDEEFEATLRKSDVSGNISKSYSVNSHTPVAKNNKLEAETEQHPSSVHHVVSLVTNITSTSGNTNDNLKIGIEDETPEESANIHNSSDQSLASNFNGSYHQNDDMAVTYLTTQGCTENRPLSSADGAYEGESLKDDIFTQDIESPQEKEDKKEEEDEMIAPSQPSIFSDGSWVLPTGKKRSFEAGNKSISADESLVSKSKHLKSDIVNETRDETFVESSSDKMILNLASRITYSQICKSGLHAVNTIDTKSATQYVSSYDSDQIRLSGHEEKENPCGNECMSSNIEQSASCNKICVGTTALDKNLSSFRTPTICMQSCGETRLSLSTKMSSGSQSLKNGQSFSPLHRTPQYRLSIKRPLADQVSSSKQNPCLVSSPRISSATKSCTPIPSAYSTQDIPSGDVKGEKTKTLLSRFGLLDRKRSIFDEDFNLTSNKVESVVHTEAPHVLYSRFLSSVKPQKSSDHLTSRTSSPKKVHFSSPLESTVQHQDLEQKKVSPEKVVLSNDEDLSYPPADQQAPYDGTT